LVSKSLLNRSDRRTGISIGSNLAVETQAEIAEIRGRDPGGGGRGVGDPVVREKNMAVERQMGDGLGAGERQMNVDCLATTGDRIGASQPRELDYGPKRVGYWVLSTSYLFFQSIVIITK
jgi:hypothetical protein